MPEIKNADELLDVIGKLALSWGQRGDTPEQKVEYEELDGQMRVMAGWLGLKGLVPKVIDKDGGPWKPWPPQAGRDEDYIAIGHRDVTLKQWNILDVIPNATREQKLANIRKYAGGLRQKLSTWEDPEFKAAFLETHNEDGSPK